MEAAAVDQNGWYTVEVSEAVEREAKARVAEQHVETTINPKLHRDATWIGFAGELVARDVFEAAGLRVEHDGGLNLEPDLIVNGVTFEVKTRGLQTTPFRPAYAVTYNAPGLHKPITDALLFCVHDAIEGTMIVLGGMRSTRFFTQAQFIRPGELVDALPFEPWTDLFMLAARDLTPTRELIERFGGKPGQAQLGDAA